MALPHFFLDNQVLALQHEPTFVVDLAPEDYRHARALRLKPKEHIVIIDAQNDYFECEVVSCDNERLVIAIAQHITACPQTRPKLIVCQGLAKSDKVDTVIRAGTELGVREFIPFVCERSVVKMDARRAAKKHARWQALAKSAAMQSGQLSVPAVHDLAHLKDLPALLHDADAVLLFWEEASLSQSLRSTLAQLKVQNTISQQTSIALIIGPEGGLSSEEVHLLMYELDNLQVVSLGPSILRTETAGIVAPALVLYELGAFEETLQINQAQEQQ